LSGLSWNIEKSFIIKIGDLSGEISNEIAELSFTFTDKFALLGFLLQNYGDKDAANFEKLKAKLTI
jgi:hypothetical protein